MDKDIKKEFENLAGMTKRGFDAVDKRFEQVDKRFIAMDGTFRQELRDLEKRLKEYLPTRKQIEKSLVNDDKILKKLETLEQEKIVREHQEENQLKWRLIITSALYKHKILTKSQLEEISQLGVI